MHACGDPNVDFEVQVQAELEGIFTSLVASAASASASEAASQTLSKAAATLATGQAPDGFGWVIEERLILSSLLLTDILEVFLVLASAAVPSRAL